MPRNNRFRGHVSNVIEKRVAKAGPMDTVIIKCCAWELFGKIIERYKLNDLPCAELATVPLAGTKEYTVGDVTAAIHCLIFDDDLDRHIKAVIERMVKATFREENPHET